jgi:hypothetical protein
MRSTEQISNSSAKSSSKGTEKKTRQSKTCWSSTVSKEPKNAAKGPEDPLAEFYDLARAEREAEVRFFDLC